MAGMQLVGLAGASQATIISKTVAPPPSVAGAARRACVQAVVAWQLGGTAVGAAKEAGRVEYWLSRSEVLGPPPCPVW